EAKALLRFEALDRLHQADIALRDHLGDWQAIAAITHRDLGDQAQMAGDEFVRRIAVAMLAPALGQHVLILRFQHRKPPDFLKIASKPGCAGENRKSGSPGHFSPLQEFAPGPPGGRNTHRRSPEPTALSIVAMRKPIAGEHYRTTGLERK